MDTPRYFVGLDLGQAQDYTALAVLSRPRRTGGDLRDTLRPLYSVPHLQRFALGTPYPRIVEQVVDLLRTPQLQHALVVADQTGVGRAVVDMLTDAIKGKVTCPFRPVTITAGQGVTVSETGECRVPKRELVGVLRRLLQARRLRVAQALPDAAILTRELMTFQVKITAAANESFGPWRAGQHDDLVLAVALAAWAGETALVGEAPT
jgi:hypothetical protein